MIANNSRFTDLLIKKSEHKNYMINIIRQNWFHFSFFSMTERNLYLAALGEHDPGFFECILSIYEGDTC